MNSEMVAAYVWFHCIEWIYMAYNRKRYTDITLVYWKFQPDNKARTLIL